jgi:hypothetical protein
MTDTIATVAGPHRHTWRTGLPQSPDGERSKPLIYIEKAACKVSKAIKDIEDLDLTCPQPRRQNTCPASVAIAFDVASICRFIVKVTSEPTMPAKPVLEAT